MLKFRRPPLKRAQSDRGVVAVEYGLLAALGAAALVAALIMLGPTMGKLYSSVKALAPGNSAGSGPGSAWLPGPEWAPQVGWQVDCEATGKNSVTITGDGTIEAAAFGDAGPLDGRSGAKSVSLKSEAPSFMVGARASNGAGSLQAKPSKGSSCEVQEFFRDTTETWTPAAAWQPTKGMEVVCSVPTNFYSTVEADGRAELAIYDRGGNVLTSVATSTGQYVQSAQVSGDYFLVKGRTDGTPSSLMFGRPPLDNCTINDWTAPPAPAQLPFTSIQASCSDDAALINTLEHIHDGFGSATFLTYTSSTGAVETLATTADFLSHRASHGGQMGLYQVTGQPNGQGLWYVRTNGCDVQTMVY